MRKWPYILMLGVAIGVMVQAAPASASVTGPTAGTGIELVGGFGMTGVLGDPSVQVNVFQIETTTLGQTVITYPDGTFVAGRATCLFVAGQTAYVTSRIVRSHGPRVQADGWLPGSYVMIGIQADQPGSPGPDLLNFSPGFSFNLGCGPNEVATPEFPLVRGDFRVFGPLV